MAWLKIWFAVLGAFSAFQAIQALRYGTITIYRYGRKIERATDPVLFWSYFVLLVVGAVFFAGAILWTPNPR